MSFVRRSGRARSLRLLVAGMLLICGTVVFTTACTSRDLGYSGDYDPENTLVVIRLLRFENEARVRWESYGNLMSLEWRSCEFRTGARGSVELNRLDTGFVVLELDPEYLRSSVRPLLFVVSCSVEGVGKNYGYAILGNAMERVQPGVAYVIEARRLHYFNPRGATPLRVETDASIETTADIISEFRRRYSRTAARYEFRVLKLTGERLVGPSLRPLH